jgi:hypothetical protein
MDFGTRIPKDGRKNEEGLYGWESPGLRARLKESKLAARPKTVSGDTGSPWVRTSGDHDMIQRDKGKT